MAALILDDIPADLMERLELLARRKSRTPAVEAVNLLQNALAQAEKVERSEVRALLNEIVRNRIVPAPGSPDSTELLREDRAR